MSIRPDWVAAASLSGLFICFVLYSCALNVVAPKGVDFVSFWAAAKLTLAGTPELAYDVAAHRAVELTAGPVGLMPFPYPPPFLLMVLPFGLASMAVALPMWLAVTTVIYVAALRRWAPLPYLFAHPAFAINGLIGQTGLLTTGIFAAALSALDRRPYLAGAVFGLLIFKPQLGVLLPLAFVAGGEWRAFWGAAASVLGMLLAALLAFGWSAYSGFLNHLPLQASFVRNGDIPWDEIASTFALLSWAGAPPAAALVVHAIVAGGAALVTWQAWREKHEQRGPILAAATVLVSPYLLTYDTLLLVLPLLVLWRARRFRALVVVWLMSLVPLLALFLPIETPNTSPLAGIACLVALRSSSFARLAARGS